MFNSMTKSNTTLKTYKKDSPFKNAPLRLFFDDIGFSLSQELAVFKSNTILYSRLRAPLDISLIEFFRICEISGEPSKNVINKLLSFLKPGMPALTLRPADQQPVIKKKTKYQNFPLRLFFDRLSLTTAQELAVFKNYPALYRRITKPENLTIAEFIFITELSNSNPGDLMAELLTQLNFKSL